MANALVPYQQVPTYLQWLRNILSYIPTVQQIWGGLERATQTYQYLDEQYRLREQQYERLIAEFERGVNSGPVAGVIERIRATALERELEVQRIAGDVRDVSTNLREGLSASGRAVANVGSALYNTVSGAASATRAAAGTLGGTVSNVVGHVQGTISTIQDYLRTIGSEASGVSTTMLTDGYNAMPRGISNFGSWVFMSGSDGGTPHYSLDYWVVYALEEALKPLYSTQNAPVESTVEDEDDTEHTPTKNNKKRRRRSVVSRPSKRRHRSAS
ncbi:VP3 [Common vole polyomavirus]|nr:VP3 [Common vole polyomavirus]ALJ83726.1 VP3 [Common vole polyomavirus]ALJ83731.1 VP3 [Common vole polyomavirus]